MTRLLGPTVHPVAAKVPAVGVLFWVIKILTTGMGEAASDYLGGVNLLLAAVVGLGGFGYALRRQLRADRYDAVTYWFAVAMVAVFGTMVADGVHVALALPYGVTTTLYALAAAAVFVYWYRSEGTLSIHSIDTRRRELLYWATVLLTFALGTAAGDLTASTLKLGYFSSALLFGAAIIVPGVAWRLGLNPVVAFWVAYVLTRPLGASVADWLAKPHSPDGGLHVGDGLVALGSVLLIAGLVAYAATAGRERATQEAAGSRRSTPVH
ncbi:hypothetical protein [Jatrophihabitans sp.]|uniref:COG4705 family protein n=1 Tax=Jatrophihabitans sp. TaxID=1932789 RepID=UPI0030C735E4|nr:hypothetical protein [Jatrophihabitans sp.]